MKVLVSAPYIQPVIDRFRPLFDERSIELVVPSVNERFSEEELLQFVGDIDGVISGDDRFSERVLQAAPRLKVISKWGTGIDSIDQEACKRYGVAVCNTPNAFSEPVADTVTGYMLCFARNLCSMTHAIQHGSWKKIPGRALRECTLGIIGVGNVGKAIVRRAHAFGMRVIGNDIIDMPENFLQKNDIEMLSKTELLQQADFVSINCTLNPTSHHLVAEDEFRVMQPTAIIINTARGAIINESALIQALQTRQIAGAALDVYENEPLAPESPLCRMENVLLGSHNSNSSPEAWERVHINTINNLLRELDRRSS